MRWFFTTFWRGFSRNGASTSEDAVEPWLRGRTYAIPFDRVWRSALALVDGGLGRWSLLEADDYEGVIQAEIAAAFLRPMASVTVRIGLGKDAQTRVDLEASAPDRSGDLGVSDRAIAAFIAALDAEVMARSSALQLRDRG